MLHLYTSKDTIKVLLAPKAGMVKGDGEVMYNEKMGLLMYDGWIAPPPEDKSYQLWVVPMEGKPISAGVFNPATSDTAHWMSKVPEGIDAENVRRHARTRRRHAAAHRPDGASRRHVDFSARFSSQVFVPPASRRRF